MHPKGIVFSSAFQMLGEKTFTLVQAESCCLSQKLKLTGGKTMWWLFEKKSVFKPGKILKSV